ncbi:Soluble calcium-activated nucleotidase 1 (SCAN-1) (Apyrase homolog), partial [Durusdinium trenchii]
HAWRGPSRSIDDGALRFEGEAFEFGMVSDLDLKSRDPSDFVWRSFLQKGVLESVTGPQGDKRYKLELRQRLILASETAKRNRSMELSELVQFEGRLLAMCDYTGLIFKVDTAHPPAGQQPQVFQRWAIADGNGEKVKPCKMEWATVKDGLLWVGSVGVELRDPNSGEVLHRDSEWVKTIDRQGRVLNLDWGRVYAALKHAANSTAYLWHEAVHFCPRTRSWYVLPRKRSLHRRYDPVLDETMGTNVLLIASEDFREITTRRVGPLQPDRGFTALRKIPGTLDHFLALKVREVGDEASTWITVFDTDGNMLLHPDVNADVDPDGFVFVDHIKFEGLEFLHDEDASRAARAAAAIP